MALASEQVGAAPLVGGGTITLHDHAGGGADVKSGTVSVTLQSSAAVTFTTAFASTPRVVVSVEDTGAALEATLDAVSTTGFTVHAWKVKNETGSRTVHWIATDAGNA